MKRENTSVSREDYLKVIWEFVQEEQVPISARLAEDLSVTPPAVTAALKRMTRDGLLRVDRDGQIRSPAKAAATPQHLALRHQLAEKLLTDVIGLDWTRAHDAAERLEHGISPEVETCFCERFGADSFCPHGLPLRGGLARCDTTAAPCALRSPTPAAPSKSSASTKKIPNSSNSSDSPACAPAPASAYCTANTTKPRPCPSKASQGVYLGKPATSRIWVKLLSS